MYYNVHTHPHAHDADVLFIENLYKNFEQNIGGRKVSMGLHPWYLETENLDEQLENLKNNITRPEVLAVGECGLDKLSTTDRALQVKAFQAQIELAEEIDKPIIIHCVKAFNDVLVMLKNIKVPVIFHGVNNKLSIIQPVIDAGYYLSFGKSLLGFNDAILKTFRETPLEQIFLETDDADVDIKEIYKSAAGIKDISEKEILLQVEKNFLNLFHQ
ncbi:TatD family hydrolase [Dyadobacter subterraneus]|uniref:TatD family hydrolase n=1 Tax=Dyadobacter subterraneus TaxID=2773304 RepID=A0ABR9WNM0_9BACT|nr:TatD family hydrolase [Dyadobacter subterraneus]MBE9465966.1 TatD family hydrolase [Dyadobacter subterraneus]